MDIRNGHIFSAEQMERIGALDPDTAQFLRPMHVAPTPVQQRRVPPSVAPYDPCPCGSGKKFKWCCRVRPGPVGLGKEA